METTLHETTTSALKDAWASLKATQPTLRIRDAAKELNVSELELLSTTLGKETIRLKEDWSAILSACKTLGKIMSLTRNEGCVLEHKGSFQKISIHGRAPHQIATVIGPIEQRVFFSKWKYGFAVVNETPRGPLKSLQFFDQAGDAILKIYLQEKSNLDAYALLVDSFKMEDQNQPVFVHPFPPENYAGSVDHLALTEAWETMKDTHDFFGMLQTFNIHRLDAIKWIGKKWAYPVNRLVIRTVLESASAEQIPIMIFVGNKGNIQIHQGKVRTIRQMGNWLNVLDPEFNMHLDESQIDAAWVVHKNTADGLVSSIELFDKNKDLIAQFFGLRKPGLAQSARWKELVDSL
jgi:putative hemin transport protein